MSVVTFGPVEEPVAAQMANCQAAEEGAAAVLCADNHLGYSMPIGGVIGYEGLVSPSAVGYDIACGNAAVRLDVKAAQVNVPQLMDDIWRTISFGVGRKNAEAPQAAVLDEIAECAHPLQRGLAQMAAQQLGTVGSGNHYVDLFEDEEGWLWIGVHFGSRGFGHKTATWALAQCGARDDSMMAPPVTIAADSELGAAYIDGMERAGRYAYAGRDWVIERVRSMIGGAVTHAVHNHHNFAWREAHAGRILWVHRKGATPAFPGQEGFVGASMGESSVILRGVDSPLSALALYSTVHGAGRVMSRTQAAGKVKRTTQWTCGQRNCAQPKLPMNSLKRGENNSLPLCPTCQHKMHPITSETVIRPGAVNFDTVQVRLATDDIVLRGGGADEAPQCYKRLPEVLACHEGTVEVLHRLRPIGVAMAGRDIVDPYKD